jgi:hypothetical protein
MPRAKQRIKKMTFQKQMRTEETVQFEDNKYTRKELLRERIPNENIQPITRGSLRPQYI